MSYIHKETFRIRPSEINQHKVIHPHHLIQLMQEASMQHTVGMKVSVWDMEEQNISWVLVKMDIKFYVYPSLGDEVEVHTFPSGLEGFFTYRDYYMYDSHGVLCATASSTWTLLDTVNRKMVKIPQSFETLVYQSESKLPLPTQRLSIPKDMTNPYNVKVNLLHLDWNGHVNNVQLIKMIFESLDPETQLSKKLKSFIVQFKAEATLGQNLAVRYESDENGILRHAIQQVTTGKDIVLAYSEWA